jgi:hypothetical protein
MGKAQRSELTEDDIWALALSDEAATNSVLLTRLFGGGDARGRHRYRMWMAVFRTAGLEFLLAGVSRVFWLAAVVAQVFLLRKVLDYSVGEGSLHAAVWYAIGVGLCSVVQSLAQSMFFFAGSRGGLRWYVAVGCCGVV